MTETDAKQLQQDLQRIVAERDHFRRMVDERASWSDAIDAVQKIVQRSIDTCYCVEGDTPCVVCMECARVQAQLKGIKEGPKPEKPVEEKPACVHEMQGGRCVFCRQEVVPSAPPGLYRHYGGHLYLVLAEGKDSNNDRNHEPTVIYISLDDPRKGQLNVRRTKEFREVIAWPDGVQRHRFVKA